MPYQQVGIARRAVDILRIGVEPHHHRSLICRSLIPCRRIEHRRPRQIIKRQVHPCTRLQQLANLIVRLVATERRVNLHEHNLRDPQPQSSSDLARQQLGNQRQDPLPRPSEFDDIQT